MTNSTKDDTEFPALYRATDDTSKRTQKIYYYALSIIIISLVGASVASLFSGDYKFSAILSVVLLSLAPLLSLFLAAKRYDRTWYMARAVAESIKTMSWRYMMRAEPYDNDTARSLLTTDFRRMLREVKEFAHRLSSASADSDQITEYMDNLKSSDLSNRMAIYLKDRIDEQRTWYTKKAAYNKRMATRWFWIMFTFQIAAVTAAALRITYSDFMYFPTEIFATAAASVLAWIQAKRFQDLGTSYIITAQEIGLVRAAHSEVEGEEQFSKFVGDAENAFSREHTQWKARRDT